MTSSSPSPPVRRPVSASPFVVGICGLVAFLIAVIAAAIVRHAKPDCQIAYLGLMVMIVTALGVFIPDLLWKKVYMRLRGEVCRPLHPSWKRALTKSVGLIGSMGFVALLYWLFPEYKGSFYDSYFTMLAVILPPWLLLAIPYIRWVDSRMEKPEDGLWQMGKLFTLQWRDLEGSRIGQHLLGWLVKGFFLALMFTYLCQDLTRFVSMDFGGLRGFKAYYDAFFDFFFFIDVGMSAGGYLFSMRLTDTHIRSTEPTMFGWAVAIICYEPFWSLIGRQYLAYTSDNGWGSLFGVNSAAYDAWGLAILALTLIYSLSTVAFGMRFSNLTHRGILTSGPYRWSKHPAYITKNLSWWMISVPFLVNGSFAQNMRHVLLLLLLNSIYFLRAKTEERHLSRDPVYVSYSEWLKENGLIAILLRHVRLSAGRKGK